MLPMNMIPPSKHAGAKRIKPVPVQPHAPRVIHEIFCAAHVYNMSVAELSRRSGVDRKTLYAWANGKPARLQLVEAVAEVLGSAVKLTIEWRA